MVKRKYLFPLLVFILVTLLTRDLPYVNVLVINKIWISYLLVLLLMLLYSMQFKARYVTYLTIILFIAAFILTLFKLTFFAEGVGAIIYFALWILFVHRLFTYLKQTH